MYGELEHWSEHAEATFPSHLPLVSTTCHGYPPPLWEETERSGLRVHTLRSALSI